MMMTILERNHEIGVVQSLGMKRKLVIFTVINESLIMGIIGSLIGGVIGAIISIFFEKYGIRLGSNITGGMPVPVKNIIYPDFSIGLLSICMFIGVFISFISGVIPSLKIFKFKIADMVRE